MQNVARAEKRAAWGSLAAYALIPEEGPTFQQQSNQRNAFILKQGTLELKTLYFSSELLTIRWFCSKTRHLLPEHLVFADFKESGSGRFPLSVATAPLTVSSTQREY